VLARDPIIPKSDKPFKVKALFDVWLLSHNHDIQDSLEPIVHYFQTSIVFTLDEGPGVLFKALAVFALRDINLSKVISMGKCFLLLSLSLCMMITRKLTVYFEIRLKAAHKEIGH